MKLFLRILFTSFLILNCNDNFSQELDFHSPIDAPFDLSEHLENIDPNSTQELTLKAERSRSKNFSIEEGYISRIEVNNYGYGKVVYIDHPNGFTSVYAHLKDFSTELDNYVEVNNIDRRQVQLKNFQKREN